MKKLLAAFLYFTFLMLPDLSAAWSGKCLRVLDGDSIVVEYHGSRESGSRKEREIRLYGVDCPEGGQAFSTEAKAFARKMVEGKTVEVQVIDCDCNNNRCRLVAWVSVDGKSLNKEIVCAGMGWWYDYYAPGEQELRECQETAKAEKKGLWKDPDAIAPWEFRKQNKKRK